jgi:hypothetical protein
MTDLTGNITSLQKTCVYIHLLFEIYIFLFKNNNPLLRREYGADSKRTKIGLTSNTRA